MRGAILLLAIGLVITGCLNSIFTKYQDNQYVSPSRKFEQPVLQTLQMFIGETGAFLFLAILKYTSKPGIVEHRPIDQTRRISSLWSSKVYLLSIPAICDILGTTLMMVGLIYTPVSIYQMTRGALIIFVAIFSILFLKHTISRIEWLSLFTVVSGITIVGLSGNSSPSGSGMEKINREVILGIGLITLGQVFTATQFVVEEHLVKKLAIEPLKLVGFEGIFGALITLFAMTVLYVTIGKDTNGIFDMKNSWKELFSSSSIVYSSFVIMVSICLFNFFGISLTSTLTATARSTMDTCRTLLVWVVSIYLGWEHFVFLQFIGFVLLVFGTLVFNGAIEIERYLPAWFKEDNRNGRLIDTIDEQIERE